MAGWDVKRWARVLLVVYWPALVVSTHWPHLNLGEWSWWVFTLDKAAHVGAFGLFTVLLVLARLAVRRGTVGGEVWGGAAIALVYAPVDEITQVVFDRTPSVGDLVADVVGIVAAAGALSLLRMWWSGGRGGGGGGGGAVSAVGGLRAKAADVVAGPERGATFVGHARTVSALTFLSRVTGLIRESVLAAAFGRGPVADAFVFGFQVPNLFRRLFGEGALSVAFIPVYAELLRRDRVGARRLASLCLAITCVLLGGMTVLGELVLGGVLASRSWTADSSLAIRLTMLMLPYMPLICVVALIGAVLQVHGRFGPSAGSPMLFNLVMIAAMLWATRGVGRDGGLRAAAYWVGLSVLAAGVLQLVWQVAALVRVESFTAVFDGTGEGLRSLARVFVPMAIGLAVFQINTFFDNVAAMALSPKNGSEAFHVLGWAVAYPLDRGSVAALAWAQRLYEFPLGIFGVAIATAIFPALAHAAAAKGEEGRREFHETLQHGLRLTVFIGLPASVGLLLVRVPASRVAFERGQFELGDSQAVASILGGYATAIWAYSMNHVLTRGFYAQSDSRTPLRVSLGMVGLNAALNLTLVWLVGAAGFAWATAMCAVLQCVLLTRAIRRYTDHLVDDAVRVSWAKTGLLTAVMAGLLWPMTWVYDPAACSVKGAAVELAVMVGVGAAVVLGGAKVLRMEELGWVVRRKH